MVMIDDEKIEREIEELYKRKDGSHPMFEYDEHLTDNDEEDVEGMKIEESKVRRAYQKIHSPKKPSLSQPKKKMIMMNVGSGTDDTRGSMTVTDSGGSGSGGTSDGGGFGGVSGGGGGVGGVGVSGGGGGGGSSSSGAERSETIQKEVEKICKEFEAMKSDMIKQRRQIDDKLEKAISDLSYMKVVLIILVVIYISHVLLSRG
ncbi:hypothetical protein LOAG_18660 [Loa loa]|uniref:Uncharacterized protein n=1 Tax=Loa loa TaxID=7209 RepID=A0A1S0UEV5_LOALO|nr:hypothetical protein LOAG_18660 [Loa loa]EJD73956.1 hypothetical protein LOAG_18660 [Loa loa]